MNIDTLRDGLPSYAKDIKLNIGTVLTIEGSPDLTLNQIYGVALSSAYAIGNKLLTEAIVDAGSQILLDTERDAAHAASIIMAMNNIYYRFTYMVSDKEYSKMPARLRMNIIGAPPIAKADFELNCLAVSIINGCAMCVDAHVHEAEKAGISKQAIQSVARIAAVMHAMGNAVTE